MIEQNMLKLIDTSIRKILKTKLLVFLLESKDQIAGIFTKVVGFEAFEGALCKLSIQDPTTQLEGEC